MSIFLDQAQLADKAFADYNFGDGVDVTDASGWEYITPGNERSRKVYIETEREDDGPAPRWSLTFTVRFDQATGLLQEAFALDHKGQVWGAMPMPKPLRPLQSKASVVLAAKVLEKMDAYSKKPMIRRPGAGFIVATEPKTNRAIAVVDGDFGRAEFKAVFAEIAEANLASDAVIVVANTATYSGARIQFSKFEELGLCRVEESKDLNQAQGI